jgi:hypothetical protein
VKFGLQFQDGEAGEAAKDALKLKLADTPAETPQAAKTPAPASKAKADGEAKPPSAGGEVVALDQFRKK